MFLIGAENSVGFHNPTEAMRVLGDAVAFAEKSEGLLRQALAQAGIDVPITVNLEINKYLDARGKRELKSDPSVIIQDPFGTEGKLLTITHR